MILVVLAAGLGSRYGGTKQLDGVGPHGAALMDYSIFDARRAGFDELVLVVRPDLDEAARAHARRYAGLRVHVVHQETGPGRDRPWGTAHAVLAARPVVRGPFAVANADDCYGAAALAAAGEATGRGEWALVGYRLADTVPDAGVVSRAICRVDGGGFLTAITERSVTRAGDGFRCVAPSGEVPVPADALVSMNLWTFTTAVFDELERGFAAFRRSAGAADEFLLPAAIAGALARGARVRVRESGGRWVGLTHPGDRERVQAALRDLVATGAYPERLW